MSTNYDRALEVLSQPTQRSDEHAYPTEGGSTIDERCWRCTRPAATDIGLCEPCSAWLHGDTDEDPTENTPTTARSWNGHMILTGRGSNDITTWSFNGLTYAEAIAAFHAARQVVIQRPSSP